MSVEAVSPKADYAEAITAELREQVDAAAAEYGPDLVGYALVTWDRRGNARSAYQSAEGPVAMALVPTFAADVLNRHVAVAVAQIAEVETLDA